MHYVERGPLSRDARLARERFGDATPLQMTFWDFQQFTLTYQIPHAMFAGANNVLSGTIDGIPVEFVPGVTIQITIHTVEPERWSTHEG